MNKSYVTEKSKAFMKLHNNKLVLTHCLKKHCWSQSKWAHKHTATQAQDLYSAMSAEVMISPR